MELMGQRVLCLRIRQGTSLLRSIIASTSLMEVIDCQLIFISIRLRILTNQPTDGCTYTKVAREVTSDQMASSAPSPTLKLVGHPIPRLQELRLTAEKAATNKVEGRKDLINFIRAKLKYNGGRMIGVIFKPLLDAYVDNNVTINVFAPLRHGRSASPPKEFGNSRKQDSPGYHLQRR